jgi:hypothetical protein
MHATLRFACEGLEKKYFIIILAIQPCCNLSINIIKLKALPCNKIK